MSFYFEQNVQRYVLQESDILSLTSHTNIQKLKISLPDDALTSATVLGTLYISGFAELTDYVNWDRLSAGNTISNINYFYADGFVMFVALSTYASFAEARADLAGTVIYYQLATPITTPLLTSGTLKAFQNGSVSYIPYYEGSHQTDASSQITLPYEGTIDKVYGYDENFDEYLLDSSEYSLTGTTLTITGALENEVFYVQMSRSEPLAPEMGVNVINNAEVAEDSVTGKFYKKTFTVANGVPTFGIEEVV